MRAPRACACVCWVQSQAHLQRVLNDRSKLSILALLSTLECFPAVFPPPAQAYSTTPKLSGAVVKHHQLGLAFCFSSLTFFVLVQ